MESLKIRFIQANDNNKNNKYMLNDQQTFSIKKMIVKDTIKLHFVFRFSK